MKLFRVLLLTTGLLATTVFAQPPADYVAGEAIVTFKTGEDLPAAKTALSRHALKFQKRFAGLSVHRHRQTGLVRAPGLTTAELIAELQRDPTVETAEPNYLRRFSDVAAPNDPDFAQLWGLQNTGQSVDGQTGVAGADIKFVGAWTRATPSTNEVVVAVLDSGIDYTHPDLVSNLWRNAGEIPGNGVDDDGDGYVDDYFGYDFVDDDGDPMDSGYHGTHVSGTIAATGNNHLGVIGVDFEAHLMALKISTNGTTISTAASIEAIQYATMMKGRGVNVVAMNASFGGPGSSSAERAAIQAAGDAGIIFVTAAGNESANNDITPSYPASYRLPNMIVVAASDQNDALASFSNYGATTVDLAAPGVNILSTFPVALAGTTATVQQAAISYAANGLSYAGLTTGITATVYNCGLGNPADFPPGVAGNIALIQRGTLYFTDKVQNAMNAGALAAIIYNNTNGNFFGSLQSPSNWIPAVSISQADGQTLLAAVPALATVVNMLDPSQIYQYLDGTSMATPHVAGAVAFAAMNYPKETVAQRIQRILGNTDFVPGLMTKVATGGRLDLQRSLTGTLQPVVSNVVAEIGGITVVLPNQPTVFANTLTNLVGASTNCLWNFGDDTTSSDCEPTHTFTGCGPATVTEVVSDGGTPVSNQFVLAVACPPTAVRLSVKVNFTPGKLATAKLQAMIQLPPNYDLTGLFVQLDVGSVAVPFTLNAKGSSVSGASTLKLKSKGTGAWQISAALKGDWSAAWTADGLVNATTNGPVSVPVLLFFDSAAPAAFYSTQSLQYKATAGKTGTAK